jgi:hypothetical protein
LPKYVIAASAGTTPAPVALTVVTSFLPDGTVGTAYASTTLTATGGTAPYTWTELELLPTGLTLSSAGVISGTPTAAGSFTVRVQVRDSVGATADSGTLPVTIAAANTLRITTANLANGRVQASYSTTLAAAGGTAPYTFSVSAGTLPAGLSLAGSTGVISGTPTTAGVSSVTFRVTDSLAATADSGSYQFVIDAAVPLEIVTASPLNAGEVDETYSRGLTASGGITPYTWAVTTGSLPTGLSLAGATGIISGTPTVEGTSAFTVTVTDSATPTASTTFKSLSLTINAAGTVEGPHDFFDELVASQYHWKSYPLRSQANIQSVHHGIQGIPFGTHTNYIYPNDPFPDKQDAAKIVMPAYPAPYSTNYEQLRMPIGIQPLALGVSSVSALVIWDFYWDVSYKTESDGVEGSSKSFQIARLWNSGVHVEPRNRFTNASQLGYVSWFDVRGYVDVSPVSLPNGRGGVFDNGPTTGFNYGGDTLGLFQNEWQVAANKWTRFFFTVTLTRDTSRATNVNFWIADEDRPATQILSGLEMEWGTGSLASGVTGPNGSLHQFWIEFNHSPQRTGGQWIAYARNVVILKDVPDYTAYLQQPRR